MPGTGLTGVGRAVAGIALAATLALPGSAGADDTAMPVWAQLAECSAVFASVARLDGYRGEGDLGRAADTAAAFRAAAVRAAAADGETDAEAAVTSVTGYLGTRWDNRLGTLTSLRSNLNWIGWCGRLGRAGGVLPLAE